MLLPEKFAEITLFANESSIALEPVVLDVGNPVAETITEDPAASEDGVIVTVGFVIVNVPATTEVEASEIMTVCVPGERL